MDGYGIPMALYHDRHGIFERSQREPESLEEQLEGKKRATQFGRLMEELGITSIASRSAQARGRIERLWGTFQDRLVSELRLAGARSLVEANQVLRDFLPRYDQRFAVPARQSGSAYRQPGEGFVPDELFCFKYQRTVGLDNVLRLAEYRLQIMPTNGRFSYAGARVEVHERMDGSLAAYYQGRCLATKAAPSEAPVLRVRNIARIMPKSDGPTTSPITANRTSEPKASDRHKPGPDHPWRRPLKLHIDRG